MLFTRLTVNRRDPLLLRPLWQDVRFPAVLPQTHALPHGREALLMQHVWKGIQGWS